MPALATTSGKGLPEASQQQLHFPGSLSREELVRKYREAALYLSSSEMETFGMALQEARAFGLPILALEGGYVSRHISVGENGYLFKNIPGLAEGLTRTLGRSKGFRKNAAKGKGNGRECQEDLGRSGLGVFAAVECFLKRRVR